MKIGRMKHRVPIYRAIITQNQFGEEVRTKELVGTYACEVTHDDNRTDETADGVNQNMNTIILKTRFTRAFGVVNNDMTAVFGGYEWDIESVLNKGFQNKMLTITCRLKGKA